MAVMLAAAGVFGTGTGWPDFAVAAAIGLLGLSSGAAVMRHAARELGGRPREFVAVAIVRSRNDNSRSPT